MKRMSSTIVVLLTLIVIGLQVRSDVVDAQLVTNAQYAAVPPFVSANAAPNVLLLIDNSGSMGNRGCESTSCGKRADGTTSVQVDFCMANVAPCATGAGTQPTTYSGYFDSLQCYVYDVANTRFVANSTKASIAAQCPATAWDGNFLNWTSFRRFDAVKKAMIGGDCTVARAADGTCPTSGAPALKTIQAQTSGVPDERAPIGTAVGTGLNNTAGNNGWLGRVPLTVARGGGADPPDLWIHTKSNGTLCADNDSTFNAGCNDGDAFDESTDSAAGPYSLRIGTVAEPTGVIQQVGSAARFGLTVFSGDQEGSRVLVGIGSRQSINFSDSNVEIFNTNTAAMIDALQESFPSTWTPLAESLYDAIRYVAQINSAFHPGVYDYPIAFASSGGTAQPTTNGVAATVGAMGSQGYAGAPAGEYTVLSGTETCPTVAPQDYITGACGRDPYFFGSNHAPVWASPSAQVTCCQTFIVVITDGEPTEDHNAALPAALQDYAHGQHGIHCTGSDPVLGGPINTTCNTHSATPSATLLGEHKTDYGSNGRHYIDDVAYWGHKNDLRQATMPVIGGSGHDISGFQNVTVYTFFAFGNINGREILMSTAKMGGFEDVNGDGIPQVGEYDKINNDTGAPVPDGQPDTYFESSSVEDLQAKLTATLASILQKSTSGTSVSVLATSSTGEGAIYQSYFFPKIAEGLVNVYWLGYTQALFLDTFGNLREDTNVDGRLVYVQDKIVKMRIETGTVKVDKYRDADADGKADDLSGNGKLCDGFSDCDQDGSFPPADADDATDAIVGEQGLVISSVVPMWEAGRKLADRDPTTRRIWTWVDANKDGLVDESGTIDDSAGEVIAFNAAAPDNSVTLAPYLRAGAAPYTAANIINFVRGADGTGMGLRNRQTQVPAGSGVLKTWKFGDPIHSTPTVVASPRERYDVLYGDASYTDYFVRWRDRRQVAYVGANDGMLHAINVGFYHRGDDPVTNAAGEVEHGWFTDTLLGTTATTLGDELWAFIPQELLPQLQFLADPNYSHVYYVDLKPKVTDVRIFTDDGPAGTHPGGWGTILIGGMRMGGSCTNCILGGGAKALQIDNFNGTAGDTRVFRSSYFVLDITDPDNPRLLFTFTDPDLGLTTSYPAVVRVNPTLDGKTSNTNAKWFMVMGSGPTEYNAGSYQAATAFVVNLAVGPSSLRKYVPDQACGAAPNYTGCSFIGDVSAVDIDLDYRTDTVYMGSVIDNDTGPAWTGKLHRLTMGAVAPFGGEVNEALWGASFSGQRRPTSLLVDFSCPTPSCTPAATKAVGPVTAPPTISQDDQTKIWIFWGTGRYFSTPDKTNADTQFFFGAKDPVPQGNCTQLSETDCEQDDLVDVSNAVICLTGCTNQVTGVTGVGTGLNTFSDPTNPSSLEGLVASRDGWFTTLPAPRERVLTSSTLLGGIVFFPSFAPQNDVCSSSGDAQIYALFYKTGTAYKESVVGTSASGNVSRSAAMGTTGALSQMAMHIGGQGGGGGGNPSSSGCASGVTAFSQSSSGSLVQTCTKPALSSWSRYISWMNERM